MSAVLQISQLNYAYNRHNVLHNFSLFADIGEIIGILGLNGAGKSTLLKLVAGILPDNRRSIQITPPADISASPSGYLAERPVFYKELSVFENLQFSAKIQGVPIQEIPEKIITSLQAFKLQAHQKQLAGQLSKGYQQRLGLAMATLHQPALLLLDEPTDGLDPQQIQETQANIKQLADSACVLVSSHRLAEIQSMCTRVLILSKGSPVYDSGHSGLPDNLEQLFTEHTTE